MKTNGKIRELLAIPCLNDNEYGHRVIWPLLDHLGIPSQMRRPQFQIENPFGGGLLRLDYLIHVNDIPIVTIEGEPKASQFDIGYKQAKSYNGNFKPRQRGCIIREMTPLFILVAAGSRAEMYRAVAHGINIEYELIEQDGQPGFLEWAELQAEAASIPIFGAPPRQGELFPGAELTVSESQQILKADAARQFFDDLYGAIDKAGALKNKDDQKIILFNRIIHLARNKRDRLIPKVCGKAGLAERAIAHVLEALSWYEKKIEANEFSGPAVARGYRNFLVQPGGRGGYMYFTGESQHRPYFQRGRVRYRNVARYFTPPEVIQQMVRLAQPQADERVIDMTCGSGGFLVECADYVSRRFGDTRAKAFVRSRLVGIDDDPFCVSCTRAMLAFLYPACADELNVFLHNCLYKDAPAGSEFREESAAERHLASGRYDLVIGNPPGNDEYSGSNRDFVAEFWAERFGHVQGGLMDHHCFVRRAIELARPDGGRICILVPEGLLARDNRGMPRLRHQILQDCELRAVISLPRVFKNNNARMAILYLVRNPNWNGDRKVLMATVLPEWTDEDTGEIKPTDLFGELESIVDRYETQIEPANQEFPSGTGLAAFPGIEVALSLGEDAEDE